MLSLTHDWSIPDDVEFCLLRKINSSADFSMEGMIMFRSC